MALSTPIIIAVSVMGGIMFISLVVFLVIYFTRRLQKGTNVRERLIPRRYDERTVTRRTPLPPPPPRLVRSPPPPVIAAPPLPRAVVAPRALRPVIPRQPPTPVHRSGVEDDWVLVKKVKRSRRREKRPRRDENEYSSSSSSSDEETQEAHIYGRRRQPWQQSMFYQTGAGGYHPPYPHLDMYDLATYGHGPTHAITANGFGPTQAQLVTQPQPTVVRQAISPPIYPLETTRDDSALPNNTRFQWEAKPCEPREYETREQTASITVE